MKIYTIKQASDKTKINYHKFRNNMIILNIDKNKLSKKNIEIIKNYQPVSKIEVFGINEKEKIINYFFLNKENTYDIMSKNLGFTIYQISKTINEYISNSNCLIAESKINKK